MCCEGGILLFTLYDQRIASSLLFVVWLEIVVVAGFYGINRFIDNIQEMGMNYGLSRPTGPIRLLIIALLGVVTPGVLIAVAIIGWTKREPISYGGENFPEVVEGFGWLIELGPLIFLPLMAIWNAFKLERERLQQVWKTMVNPSKSWYEAERDGETKSKSNDEENRFEHDNIAYSPSSSSIANNQEL